jgi:carbonic anhydrase/acetyltransferase-like protein (isoleucine patch superfamily)
MKTMDEVLKIVPSTKAEGWHQHSNGKGWVYSSASVADSAYVGPDARVYGKAQVSDNAKIYGNARVYGNAKISDNGWVFGDAWVYDNAQVSDYAWVYGDARVFGDAQMSGDAQVNGDAKVFGDAWKTNPLFVQGTKHAATNCKHGWLAIGCQVRTFADWQANVETIAEKYGYTKEEAAEYRAIVDFMVKVGK